MKKNRCCEGAGSMIAHYFFLFTFTIFFSLPYTSYSENENAVVSTGFSKDEINRGRRFFMGLLPFERPHESCVSCHYMNSPDTLNWNPSAVDIAQKFAGRDSAAFYNAIMQPTGKVMEAAHKDFELSEEDISYIKIYLNNLALTGPEPIKPSYNLLLVFLLLGVIITWSLLDLIVFKKVKIKAIPILLFVGAFVYQLYMLSNESIMLGRSPGYEPDQPIKFSHKVHATDNQIDCMYCHHTAGTSKTANIPSTSLCMNCHIVVREGTHSGRFEIDKIVQAHEQGQSVEWIRVHDLPDHVFFSHAQHVGAGKLDCMQCHGQVENMHVVRQVEDLSMGWCLECHRSTKVDFIENDYYSTFEAFHGDLEKGVRDSILAVNTGANDCMKCHY